MPPQPHTGGSFAPPLSDETLADYGARIAALPAGPVKDACAALLACCAAWWELPEPTHGPSGEHPIGPRTNLRGEVIPAPAIVPLHPDHAAALDQHLPWEHELEAMKGLFEGIDPVRDKATRDMAHHLLWHAVELSVSTPEAPNGREPITKDKLGL